MIKRMIARTLGLSALAVVLGSAAWADDAASGMASGKRQHKPLTVTKELDKATPALAKSQLTENTADESATEKSVSDDVAEKTNKSEAARSKRRPDGNP